MWHEARKQERLIRGMIVDYRRRAERRKDFYEKIKAEPTQFLQLHGRPCKIHLDPAVAAAGEGPAIMMPWQGDSNNVIDRFDVRAHLDFIPEVKIPYIPAEQLSAEERQCNYERYRILAQNSFLGISEDKFLHQLAIEEQFGVTIDEKEAQRERFNEKEKKGMGAAIGYNYNDPGAQPSSSNGPESKTVEQKDSDEESDIEIIDVDLSIDVNKMEASQAHELNAVGPQFGMAGCDLFSFLTGDADDAEHQKQLLREEKEKAMFSGRKSRRERRAHRDKKLANRTTSPPSYAAPSSLPSARSPSRSRSPTRSPSPQNHNIQFITSFGGDEEDNKTSVPQKPLYADKLKHNLNRKETYSEIARKPRPWSSEGPKYTKMGPHRPHSRSMSKSRSRSKSYSRSRSRSGSRVRSRSRSKSYSRSMTSRSRSRSPGRRSPPRAYSYRNKRSRTPANYSKHNDSRSMSYESSEKVGVASRPVARYYGRRRDDRSSSELSIDSDSSVEAPSTATKSAASKTNTNQNHLRLSGSSSKGPSRETLTLKEKLKRKMQAQLSRQLRADKRAEADRLERESRRQARRDEEMRQLAIKLRRKQREMRHQQNRRSSEDGSNGSRSGSSSRESPSRDKKSRSRSKSPQNRPISVWEEGKEPAIAVARPRYPAGESSQQEPRRRQEDEYHQDRDERYPVRGYNYPRQEENSYHPERRRPFADRGGFRGDRYAPQPYDKQDSDDSLEGNPRRVKLVDY